MATELETLLNRYESGELSRRELLGAFALMLLPTPAAPEPAPAIGAVRQMNHVTLYVRDVERSQRFYQSLFGMPVVIRQDTGVNLSTGAGFLGLYPADNEAPAINHFCLGMPRFHAESARSALARHGVDASIRQRGDTAELYFTDPDGIRVQLQDVRYRGGVGPAGDRDP